LGGIKREPPLTEFSVSALALVQWKQSLADLSVFWSKSVASWLTAHRPLPLLWP